MRIERNAKRALKRAGFSLVEIVIAIAVIGIMSAAAVPLIQSTLEKAKISRAQSEMQSLRDAALNYATDKNLNVDTVNFNLQTLIDNQYVPATMSKDPWNGLYNLKATKSGTTTEVELGCGSDCKKSIEASKGEGAASVIFGF